MIYTVEKKIYKIESGAVNCDVPRRRKKKLLIEHKI